MDDMVTINDAGLNSLSGFSFQIKVFILQMTQIQQGHRVEFETLDDVTVSSLPHKDSVSDSCFKWNVNENTSTVELFQVKQTNVTEAVGRQVLYNWLLAYNKKPGIKKFKLYIACGYSFKANTFTNSAKEQYKTIMDSDKNASA
ncbi:MAG: hypothetical protein VB106_04785, partial [Clostridiaceae bacterium]|nr:hypothetical protein [Clostridiaceae bacterium]